VLTCPVCGGHLTASMDKLRGQVRYYCHRAIDGRHPRTWVSESQLLPLVTEELKHATFETRRRLKGKAEDEAKAATLGRKRDRILDMYADELIDKAERDRRLGEVAVAESSLSVRRMVRTYTIPPDVEHDDPAKVNAYLRRLLAKVVVRNMTKPAKRGPSNETWDLEFVWRDPSMRVEDTDDAA